MAEERNNEDIPANKEVKTEDSRESTETDSSGKLLSPEQKEYFELKRTLNSMVQKKKDLDYSLENIEETIYNYETEYLQDTISGNIVKGFDQYTRSNQNKKKSVFTDRDRIFSQSNTSFDAES